MRISDWSSDVCSSDLLALQVGLSKTPCQQRVKRLVDSGLIVGFRAIVDPAKVGLDPVAFTEVKLSDTREEALRQFHHAVRQIPEDEACNMIASSFDYLFDPKSVVSGKSVSVLVEPGGRRLIKKKNDKTQQND